MAGNLLPLLLIGGGAAVVIAAQGKKKPKYKFEHLRVGPGCKSAYLDNKDVLATAIRIQENDESARQELLDGMKLFWLEDLPHLILKVQPDPGIWDGEEEATPEKMEKGAMELLKASLPSCYVSKEALKNALKKALKGAKSKEDIEKRIMPHFARVFIRVLFIAGYQVNLARAGHIDAGDLSDFEQDIMEGLPEEAGWMTGEEEGPVDPNQMAAMRPGFFTEAALLAVGG